MHKCEFCHIQFTPRNQVKNPRACLTENCQKLRQRDNEKSWKQKHLDQYDKEYHEIQREKRTQEIEDILKSLLDCIKAASDFLEKIFNSIISPPIFHHLFLNLEYAK